jgi:hypothetical protein
MKSHIFILAPDTAEYEAYNSNRYSYIFHALKSVGDTTVLTSTFDHYWKTRAKRSCLPNIVYLSEPGYKKNVSPRRVLSNLVFIHKAFLYLVIHARKNDIVIASVPHNSLAFFLTILKTIKRYYLVIDIHDLLPESLIPLLKEAGYPRLPIGLVKFWSFLRNFSISRCDLLTATCRDNLDRFKYLLRNGVGAHAILLGVETERVREIKAARIIGPNNAKINVVLAGTLGIKNDIPTIITMLQRYSETLRNRINILFLGDGEYLPIIQKELQDMDYIYFKGRASYEDYLAYLKGSDIGINSFVQDTDVKYSYRITDYFACGLAVVNNLVGSLAVDIEEYRLGANYEAGRPDSLYQQLMNVIIKIEKNRLYFKDNIRKYVSERLDRERIYRPLIEFVTGKLNKGSREKIPDTVKESAEGEAPSVHV